MICPVTVMPDIRHLMQRFEYVASQVEAAVSVMSAYEKTCDPRHGIASMHLRRLRAIQKRLLLQHSLWTSCLEHNDFQSDEVWSAEVERVASHRRRIGRIDEIEFRRDAYLPELLFEEAEEITREAAIQAGCFPMFGQWYPEPPEADDEGP